VETKKFIRSAPHLPVKNLQQTFEFYKKIGFSEEWILRDKDGGIKRDDMRVLFAEDEKFVNNINNKQHRLPLMWFVENIDEVYAEFKERQIAIADALRMHLYGCENLLLLILMDIMFV
jgi:hypothetical protein